MKKILLGICALTVLHLSLFAQTNNTLSPKEKRSGWKLLFDGKTTDGWHTYLKPEVGAWKATDGVLQLDPTGQGRGDIVTNKEYENYDLTVEWKIPEGGNSGIIFNVHEDPAYKYTFLTGIEMQVLDDIKADDNKQANHLAGSLYDLIAPAHPAKPAGEWNKVKIRRLNGHLTFWMNGEKVVETQVGGAAWKAMIPKSKYADWKDYATFKKGHIALQDHGAAVAYRNIKIKQL